MSGLYAVTDVDYPPSGGARAAVVLARDPRFESIVTERVVELAEVAEYQPGRFYLRELPALAAVLEGLSGLGLLIVDGYVDLEPGRPGLGAHCHEAFGLPVIGVAKTAFRAATHAVEVRRGDSDRPLFVTAAGFDLAAAADLVRDMAGRYRLPEAVKRVDALARGRVLPSGGRGGDDGHHGRDQARGVGVRVERAAELGPEVGRRDHDLN